MDKVILTADYHTHTPYSHGKNTVEENVARAKELGLKHIGFSDHGYTHIAFGIRRKEIEDYKAECKNAQEKYGIDVLVGLEANIRGVEGKSDLKEKDFEDFDITFAENMPLFGLIGPSTTPFCLVQKITFGHA